MKSISVRLTDEMIEKIASFTGRTQSDVVREAIIKELEGLEDERFPIKIGQKDISDVTFYFNGDKLEIIDYSLYKGMEKILEVTLPYMLYTNKKEVSIQKCITNMKDENYIGRIVSSTEFSKDKLIYIKLVIEIEDK